MTSAVGPVQAQVEALTSSYAAVEAVTRVDGTTLIQVPSVPLPPGWNKPATRVWFVVPVGYPLARPDCFWAEHDLRLGNGGMPANSGMQTIPGTTQQGLWFSWHISSWDPGRDSLASYVRVMRERLARVR